MNRPTPFHTASLALTCALVIALPPPLLMQSVLAQQTTPAPAPTAAPAVAAAPAATTEITAGVDPGWPRSYRTANAAVVIYQPQIETWNQQKRMVAWSAVSYTPTGAKPTMGAVKFEADTRVALDDRLVSFNDFVITETHFSTLSRAQSQDLATGLKEAVPVEERVIALDHILAAVDKSTIRPREAVGVKADPPKVFSSTRPAILVAIDGPVIWNSIQNVDLSYAVNTNWDLFQYAPTNALYLLNGNSWYTAADLAGPWTPVTKLPESFSKLPADDNFKEVKSHVPGRSVSASAMPTVFTATEAAELLLFTGVPAYQAVPGSSLLWVNNTESDVFRAGKAGLFYYLVAGRWFSAPEITGPWTFATPTLPAEFKTIPLEHPRARVRASVPGTDEAIEAVLVAQIPQTARVNRKDLKAPDVVYQGDPQFQPIEGTKLERAANTDKDIIKVGDLYYMCFQAVWFMSRAAAGPWEVATSIPVEIYSIPASSPAYNVTYVTIQESQPSSDWVTFAYVAGYTGMMIAWGCAVWGTGWYYPPYVWRGGMYPIYYGYPRTYGFSAWYNPYTGAYGRGAAVYGPYGGAGAGAVYNPRTGTYARGATAYGPYGSRSAAQAWNPRTGTYAQTRQGSNVYGNWGSSSVQRGDDWARTGHVTNYRTGATTRGIQTSNGGSAISRSGIAGRTTVAEGAGGNVYAGHDGNVYRRTDDGSWQSWDNGGWNNTDRPTPTNRQTGTAQTRQGGTATQTPATRPSTTQRPTTGQLNRDATARTSGTQRTQQLGSYRSSPSRQSAGSLRGGGGGGRRR